MKKKILVVGLIGLLLAGGLVLAGCDDKSCPKGGICSASIDSYGNKYAGEGSCGNGDCAVSKATRNYTPGKHSCSCH